MIQIVSPEATHVQTKTFATGCICVYICNNNSHGKETVSLTVGAMAGIRE